MANFKTFAYLTVGLDLKDFANFNVLINFAANSSIMIRTKVSGTFPAKVSFVTENQVKIVLPDNTYIAVFASNYNYLTIIQGDDHFIRLMSANFSIYMYGIPRPDFNTAVRNINADLYRDGYEMMTYLLTDQDKIEERQRIGKRIKELRQKLKLDARTLAIRAGIDASNLSRIEQGHYSVGLDTLAKIANALNAKIEIVEKE